MALVAMDAEERKRRSFFRTSMFKRSTISLAQMGKKMKARLANQSKMFPISAITRYTKACAVDRDVGNFDKELQASTMEVFRGVRSHGFSVDSIKGASLALQEMDKAIRKINSDCLFDFSMWNPSVSELSIMYLGISKQIQELYSLAEALLKGNISLEEVGFADIFSRALERLRRRQSETLETFIGLRDKLDKKLENVQSWTKISNVAFGATAAALLSGSVMAAAFEAPQVAASFAAGFTLGSAGTWLYSSWKKYEETIKGQRVVVDSLCENTRGLLKDLDNVIILLGGSSHEVVIDIGEEEGFTDEMGIHDSKHTGSCSRDIPYAPDHDQVIPKEVLLVCA